MKNNDGCNSGKRLSSKINRPSRRPPCISCRCVRGTWRLHNTFLNLSTCMTLASASHSSLLSISHLLPTCSFASIPTSGPPLVLKIAFLLSPAVSSFLVQQLHRVLFLSTFSPERSPRAVMPERWVRKASLERVPFSPRKRWKLSTKRRTNNNLAFRFWNVWMGVRYCSCGWLSSSSSSSW